ncbi:ComEC/Rec2 family competence protein [Algoriphagus sp.]|uniref:ComEC/Rec2 family competence protein n=1 Tax=Algoriphagus sp. TaxID=1872435 RepID=UPI00391B82A3
MKFSDFPFLRYLPFLIGGVLFSQIEISTLILASTLGLSWIIYLGFIIQRDRSNPIIPAFLGYFMLFILGFLLSEIQQNRKADLLDEELGISLSYLARVIKHDVEKPNSFENQLEVIAFSDSLGWKESKGKVLIYHKSKKPLLPGQNILVEKSPEKIPPPIFPNEFDYSRFLARKDIHFRQFIGDKFTIIDSSEVNSSKYGLANFRKKLVGIIEDKVPNPESRQIAAALLLGQKENLDKEIKNAYAETGTMHILAVSGLHVGIIYAILLFPLKGIKLKSGQKSIYLFVVILLIWTYAILTGFSPSVVRAATMFSLFTAGQMRKRKPSSFNILAFSAMIMITMDPGVIFEVGFQLSYAAVAGILLVQPLIVRFWLPPNRVLEYAWQLTTVSIAAQLATFPLSVYYFHIFPTYFLIANLFIIPLAFLVMSVGIIFLIFSWIPMLSDGLGGIVSWMIWLQNWITHTIQLFPGGNLERLTITLTGMLLVWVILICWANWEFGNRKKLVYLMACLFLVWSGDRFLRKLNLPEQELLVFSGEKGFLLDFKIGNRFYSWNEDFPTEQISFSVDPNRIAVHRPHIIETIFATKNDSLQFFPIWNFSLNPKSRTFFWSDQKPKRIEKISSSQPNELISTDSLNTTIGAFRVVF